MGEVKSVFVQTITTIIAFGKGIEKRKVQRSKGIFIMHIIEEEEVR